MANANRPVGFTVAEDAVYYPPKEWPVEASATITKGDMVYINSDGRVGIATSATTAGDFLGVAASSVTSATVGDPILVYDNPRQIFQGQISTGALADPYTTRSLAACFDLAGTTGVQYINAASATSTMAKIIGVGKEPNGSASATGLYQKKLFRIARGAHAFGCLA